MQLTVHEAATFVVVHGYEQRDATYMLEAGVTSDALVVIVRDYTVATTPVSALARERRGFGFRLIHALSDHANITSQPGCGTRVELQFGIGNA